MAINILYEDSYTVVVEKPQGLSVQKDSSRNKDLLSETGFMLKIKGSLAPQQSLHLINRLDRPVGGIVLMAKSSQAARYYSQLIQKKALDKYYLCIVMGTPETKPTHLTDYLRKAEQGNYSMVTTEEKGKLSRLCYRSMASHQGLSFLEVHLITGRHHQIRVQLAHSGLPIWGDVKYNPESFTQASIALWASRLTFIPFNQSKAITIQSTPDMSHEPWHHFS